MCVEDVNRDAHGDILGGGDKSGHVLIIIQLVLSRS